MIKLQQFYIMKFTSSKLDRFNYHIDRFYGKGDTYNANMNQLRNNGEIIALGDNQALRTIRSIRYERFPAIIQYDEDMLQVLYTEKKWLKKQVFTNDVKKQISIINTKIDSMLFVPEYVSIVIEDNKHYKNIIKNGMYISGHKYVRLMCSAGQARVNTVIMILESFEKEVKKRLQCGAKPVKITKNKYNAYFALSSSSTYLIPKPNILVIPDCEIEMDKEVDWISKVPNEEKTTLSNNERVERKIATLIFNLFDGCGASSVEYAMRVAKALGIDYIPSAFCLRCAYVKGMNFVIDFKEYAREHGIEYVTDLYGNKQRIEDIDLILTKSQFKLYNAYDSIEQYDKCCEENGFMWGVTKVAPKTDDTVFRSNYQFCQAIDITRDEDVEELCRPTKEWLDGVASNKTGYSLLFLLGRICDKDDIDFNDILNLTSDNVAKSLILNKNMIEDEYIKSTIVMSINKKIKESYLGKLILDGNFSVMIPDMYAFMQHAFGQEVTGALKEFECYSNFWNNREKKEIVAMRSPLTWRSEVNKLNVTRNEITDKWFKYLTSGIVYNVWGCDCMIHADSDFDGDIVATTDNPIFLKCRYNNLPITYHKNTVDKEYIKEEELYLADIQSFNSTIGQITNVSTSFYELLSKFEGVEGCEKYEAEIIERLKLIRKAQGDSIDKAKGIKIEQMPKHWTRVTYNQPEDETKESFEFNNLICADRKPYFFRYLYPRENSKYLDFLSKENDYCEKTFALSLDELLQKPKEWLSYKESEYLERYYREIPLIDYNGRMNKICHYMETNLKEIRKKRSLKTPRHILELMCNDPTFNFESADLKFIDSKYKEYKKAKEHFRKSRKTDFDDSTSATNNFTDIAKQIKNDILDNIERDMKYISDLAVFCCYITHSSATKDFCWDLFGNQIVENIKNNSNEKPSVPVLDENGDIEYLGKKYRMMEVDV